MKNFEYKIAKQYIKGRKSQKNIISFNVMITIIGLMFGVMALVLTMSLLNGFKDETIQSYLKRNGKDHIIIGLTSNNSIGEIEIEDYNIIKSFINDNKNVVNSNDIYYFAAQIKIDEYILRGVIKASDKPIYSEDGSSLVPENGSNVLFIHQKKLNAYNLREDKDILVTFPEDRRPSLNGELPIQKKMRFIAVEEFDLLTNPDYYYYGNLNDLKKITRRKNPSYIVVELNDPLLSDSFKLELEDKLKKMGKTHLEVWSWQVNYQSIVKLLELEKIISLIFLALIILISAFSLLSTMIMTVNEKRAEIAILKTMGVNKISLIKIFIFKGLMIGLLGTLLGLLLGITISLNVEQIVIFIDKLMGFKIMESINIYYNLKAIIYLSDLLYITLIAFLLIMAASIYPSWKASKINPAEALKNE